MSTETTTYCARHPKQETGVSCASCGVYICPDCMVVTPVGMKCPACSRGTNTALYEISLARLLLTVGVSLAAGVIASFIGNIGFFAIFISSIYGYAAGSMILKASGMKRGQRMEIIAGVGMVVGAIGVKALSALLMSHAAPGISILYLTFGIASLRDIIFWAAVVIATACAMSKIRYL